MVTFADGILWKFPLITSMFSVKEEARPSVECMMEEGLNILGETVKCEQSSRKTLDRLENCSRFAFRWWYWAWSMLSSRATFCFNMQTTNQQRWIQPGVDWAPKTWWDKKKHRVRGCMQGSDHDWPWKAISIKSKVRYDDQEHWNTISMDWRS